MSTEESHGLTSAPPLSMSSHHSTWSEVKVANPSFLNATAVNQLDTLGETAEGQPTVMWQQQRDHAHSEQQPKPIYNPDVHQKAQSIQGQTLLSPLPSAATLQGGCRHYHADPTATAEHWIQEQPGATLTITQGQMRYLPQQQMSWGTRYMSFLWSATEGSTAPCPCMFYAKHEASAGRGACTISPYQVKRCPCWQICKV